MAKSAANSRLQACLDHSITAQGDRWESPIAYSCYVSSSKIPTLGYDSRILDSTGQTYQDTPIEQIEPMLQARWPAWSQHQSWFVLQHYGGKMPLPCCNPIAYSQNTFQEAWLAFNWTKLLNVSNATQNRPQCWLIHIWSLSSEEQDRSILLREINLFWSCRQQT